MPSAPLIPGAPSLSWDRCLSHADVAAGIRDALQQDLGALPLELATVAAAPGLPIEALAALAAAAHHLAQLRTAAEALAAAMERQT